MTKRCLVVALAIATKLLGQIATIGHFLLAISEKIGWTYLFI